MNLRRITSLFKDYLVSPDKIALSLALVFSVLSAVLVPQMTVNDENAHFLKAYSLTTGTIAGNKCSFPQAVLDRASKTETNFSIDATEQVSYAQVEHTTCGSAGNYTPIMHLPQAIGISVGKLFHVSPDLLVLFGRLSNALFYSFALFLIVRLAKHGKWAYVVIGLFPLMIHTAGSLSGDVMNNVVVMATLALMFNLVLQKARVSKKQIVFLVALTILLAMTKATNIIMLLPLLALPARLFKPNSRLKIPINLRKWIIVSICGLTALAVVILTQRIFGSALFISEHVENPLLSDPLRFLSILFNTYINPALGYGDQLLRGVVGEFSSFTYHLPTVLVLTELLLLLVVLFDAKNDGPSMSRKTLRLLAVLSLVSFVVFVVAITLALYSAWAIMPFRLGPSATYADGVQGRYFTAALLLLLPLSLFFRSYTSITMKTKRLLGIFVFVVSTFCLIFYLAQTYLHFA